MSVCLAKKYTRQAAASQGAAAREAPCNGWDGGCQCGVAGMCVVWNKAQILENDDFLANKNKQARLSMGHTLCLTFHFFVSYQIATG